MTNAQGKQRGTLHQNLVGRTLRNGEYQVKALIGHGGMGQVFLASHVAVDVPLALKQARADQPLPEIVIEELDCLLQEKDLRRSSSIGNLAEKDFPVSGGTHTDRFLREALFLARLQHPVIPTLYDYFFEDGYWYLVMDYIPGPTLTAYLRQHAPLSALQALNYAVQLCDVLDYLHQQVPPVIFRDLKPANVILTPGGRLMLVDFGIARYFKTGQFNDTTDFGSPGYASPEQYKGVGQTDGRSDIYSLGVILHEMLSGQRPVGGKLLPLRTLNPAISAVLSGLVTVATRAEPTYRFQSAHNFYLTLERVYTIEERRAFSQRIHDTEKAGGDLHVEASLVGVQTAGHPQGALHHPPDARPLHINQRLQAREILQGAHRERIERERQEIHLASVEEGLNQRSIPRSIPPLPAAEDHQNEVPTVHFPSTLRRVIRTSFMIALILFLLMASLLVYGRFFHHPGGSVVSQSYVTVIPSGPPISSWQSSWQVLPSLPSPEADNTTMYVQVQGRAYIYMSGGFRGSKSSPHYDRGLYRYDIAAAHWEMLGSKDFPGMLNNAVALDEQNHLFFTAGYSPDLNVVPSLLYMYQPTDGTLQKIQPPAQVPIGFGAAMVADHHGHLYITEGFLQAGSPHVSAGVGWYRYDIASGAWHSLAPLPVGLGYVVLAPDSNGGILLLGGAIDAWQHLPTSQVYRYDISQNVWTQEPSPAPVAFSGAASCLSDQGHLVIVGGYDSVHNTAMDQSWLLDLQTLHWTPLAPLPSGGSLLGASACDGQGHVFLVRGATDPTHPTADFWELRVT